MVLLSFLPLRELISTSRTARSVMRFSLVVLNDPAFRSTSLTDPSPFGFQTPAFGFFLGVFLGAGLCFPVLPSPLPLCPSEKSVELSFFSLPPRCAPRADVILVMYSASWEGADNFASTVEDRLPEASLFPLFPYIIFCLSIPSAFFKLFLLAVASPCCDSDAHFDGCLR